MTRKKLCKNRDIVHVPYPQLGAAAERMARRVIFDLIEEANAMGDVIWLPSLTCATCDKFHDHDGKPLDVGAHVGRPMRDGERTRMLLETLIQNLQRHV